jgi:hypothetical protein
LLHDLERALDELPPEQREVFSAHELDRRSFEDMAADTGVNVNTLLARKHYAVKRLRESLKAREDYMGSKGWRHMSENRGVFWFKIALVLTIWIIGFGNAVLHL